MIILHQSFSYFFILLFLSSTTEMIQGSQPTKKPITLDRAIAPFRGSTVELYDTNAANQYVIKNIPNEIISNVYVHGNVKNIKRCINLARSCKTAYSLWIQIQQENPFHYIPLLTDSFNNQAYEQTITSDYDKERKIALFLDKNSWIFNKENGNFFVFGSTLCNPYDRWEPKLITLATEVTKRFGALLCSNYNKTTNCLTFSNITDFYNFAHNKNDRMYYVVNKDRTKILLAGWMHCPRYVNDGMDELKNIRLINPNDHQIVGYRMHPYLEQLNYTGVEFVNTNDGEENITIYGKGRQNKNNIIISFQKLEDGTPIANITGMIAAPHPITVYEVLDCQKRKYLPLDEDGTDYKKFDVQFTHNPIPDNDKISEQGLPLNEEETVSVQEILALHKKGKIRTEGMEQFIQILNDPEKNKAPENKTPESKVSRYFSWRTIALFTGIGAGAAILIWITFKKELLHQFNLLTHVLH